MGVHVAGQKNGKKKNITHDYNYTIWRMFEENKIRQADAQVCIFITMPRFAYIRITGSEMTKQIY